MTGIERPESSADLIGSTTFSKFLDNVRQSKKFTDDELDGHLKSANLQRYIKAPDAQNEDDLEIPF